MRSSLISYIDRHRADLFDFLEKLVLQPSYTFDKDGVDTVGKTIIDELTPCQMVLDISEETDMGNHLVFRSRAMASGSPSLLLVGHMDTVYPPESQFNWFRAQNGKVFGPGVIDMKGGLAAAVYALKALYSCDLLRTIPITFICNSDEEKGSPTSRDLIIREAEKAAMALVFECGGPNGEIVTGRKGKRGYTIEVLGEAGHAAFAGDGKSSAILELAQKTIELEKLNNPENQLVVNVGVVSGGIGANTIAEKAEAQIDTRFVNHHDGYYSRARINDIVSQCHVPGTRAKMRVTSEREPMEQTARNHRLFRHIQREAEQLHIDIKEEFRSGVSDANTIATTGTPVVDGLGPIGGCDHSDKEYMVQQSLPERTVLAAVSIASAWQRLQLSSQAA